MTQQPEFAHGTPSWVDLSTPDTGASGTFYGTVFGWTAEAVADPDAGGYTMLTLDGRNVGALAPLQSPGQPTAWTTYVNVDDVDKTVELATAHGGSVLAPAMDVFTSGRMAVVADPSGAAIALWQPKEHRGADVVDEPGAFTWTELSTRDPRGVISFYENVFGWRAETAESDDMPYTEFKVGDRSVAGMMPMGPEMPADVPPYWMPYFASADIERTVTDATALGANVMVPPSPIPGGSMTFSILRDPQGATFGVLQGSGS